MPYLAPPSDCSFCAIVLSSSQVLGGSVTPAFSARSVR